MSQCTRITAENDRRHIITGLAELSMQLQRLAKKFLLPKKILLIGDSFITLTVSALGTFVVTHCVLIYLFSGINNMITCRSRARSFCAGDVATKACCLKRSLIGF